MNLTDEQIDMITVVGETIRHQTFAQEMVADFRKKYPFAIPPNLLGLIEENLKDNIQVLYREMNVLHKPNSEKRRWVCTKCKTVFAMPVPGGLCDACKAATMNVPNRPDYAELNAALTRRRAEAVQEIPKWKRPEAQEEETTKTETTEAETEVTKVAEGVQETAIKIAPEATIETASEAQPKSKKKKKKH